MEQYQCLLEAGGRGRGCDLAAAQAEVSAERNLSPVGPRPRPPQPPRAPPWPLSNWLSLPVAQEAASGQTRLSNETLGKLTSETTLAALEAKSGKPVRGSMPLNKGKAESHGSSSQKQHHLHSSDTPQVRIGLPDLLQLGSVLYPAHTTRDLSTVPSAEGSTPKAPVKAQTRGRVWAEGTRETSPAAPGEQPPLTQQQGRAEEKRTDKGRGRGTPGTLGSHKEVREPTAEWWTAPGDGVKRA